MLTTDHAGPNAQFASTDRQYWLFQIIGWSALTMLSYLSLTLWYNPGQWVYAFHTVVQSALGLLVSHPLRMLARRTWTAPLPTRLAANGAGIIAASLLWTWLRLTTFTALTGERVSHADWGGWLFASVIVYGSWAVCYHAIKYYREWLEQRELAVQAQRLALEAKENAHSEMVKRLRTETLVKEAKMRMLKYQLNPHFLFNALNSVTARVRQGESDRAVTMLARIADFLRLSLEEDEKLDHTLDEEVEMVELYLEIEKARFGDRLTTAFEISRTAGMATVPSLLLQPLVENAIKHGVGRRLEPTEVTVSAWTEGSRLEVRVCDTGPGLADRPDTDREGPAGIGLKNVEERLRAAFGEDFSLRLDDAEPTGTCVSISMPCVRHTGALPPAPEAELETI